MATRPTLFLMVGRPKPTRWGMMHLATTGRRTGQSRSVIVAYFEDGPNLVTLAMNGWADAEPAWWLNLQASPEATVTNKDGTRAVRARAAQGAEHDRLWQAWKDHGDDVDGVLRAAQHAHDGRRPRAPQRDVTFSS